MVKISDDEAPLPQHLLPLPQQHQQDDDNEDDEESDGEEEPDKELPHNGPLIISKPQVAISADIEVYIGTFQGGAKSVGPSGTEPDGTLGAWHRQRDSGR